MFSTLSTEFFFPICGQRRQRSSLRTRALSAGASFSVEGAPITVLRSRSSLAPSLLRALFSLTAAEPSRLPLSALASVREQPSWCARIFTHSHRSFQPLFRECGSGGSLSYSSCPLLRSHCRTRPGSHCVRALAGQKEGGRGQPRWERTVCCQWRAPAG